MSPTEACTISNDPWLSFDNWCSSGGKVGYTRYGRAYNFFDLSNAQTMNIAFLSAVYSQLITPVPVQSTVRPSPISASPAMNCSDCKVHNGITSCTLRY